MDNTISQKEIQAAIRSIAYRKAYNARADVIAKRKLYSKTRAERIKLALVYIKQHPEVVA